MIGKIYELPEANRDAIIEAFEEVRAHRSAMDHHASMATKTIDSAWKTIVKLIPEIEPQEYVYDFNLKDCTVVCKRVVSKIDYR